MDDSQSPVLNPGLGANEIASPDNLGVEPIPAFVDNDVPVEIPEDAPKKKSAKKK